MKSAKEWSDKFTRKHVINTRGNEVEGFVKEVQKDAREDLSILLMNIELMLTTNELPADRIKIIGEIRSNLKGQ